MHRLGYRLSCTIARDDNGKGYSHPQRPLLRAKGQEILSRHWDLEKESYAECIAGERLAHDCCGCRLSGYGTCYLILEVLADSCLITSKNSNRRSDAETLKQLVFSV